MRSPRRGLPIPRKVHRPQVLRGFPVVPYALEPFAGDREARYPRPPKRLPPNRSRTPGPNVQSVSPLEELLLHDARPGFPMCFFIDATLEGPLCGDRLRAAIAVLGRRHPRIRQRVSPRGYSWVWLPPDVDPELRVMPARPATGPDAGVLETPIDLTTTSGLRFVAIETAPRHWRVVLQVHHAVCDGVAGLELLGDMWTIYHGAEPPPFRTGRPLRFGDTILREATSTPSSSWKATLDFLRIRPVVLQRPTKPLATAPESIRLPYAVMNLSADVMADTRRAATACGATVNDVIVAAAARVLCAWNHEAHSHGKRTIRINMPTSLRMPGSREPANNNMSYAFLDKFAAECVDRPALVASIARASRWIQSMRSTEQFLVAISNCRRIPGLLRLITRLPTCFATAVVSNVGNAATRMRANVPHDDGCICPADLRITGMAGVPPIRPKTLAAIGVVTYAGVTSVTLLCDEAQLGIGASRAIASAIGNEVADFAAIRGAD